MTFDGTVIRIFDLITITITKDRFTKQKTAGMIIFWLLDWYGHWPIIHMKILLNLK